MTKYQNINRFHWKILSLMFSLAFAFSPSIEVFVFAGENDVDSSNIPTVGQLLTFDQPSNYTWIVPVGVASVKAKVWGAGAAGGNGEKIENAHRSGLGGGAGAYSEKTIVVKAGDEFSITVGAGGHGIRDIANGRQGNDGEESRLEGSSDVIKAGGGNGGASYVAHGNPIFDLGIGGVAEGGNVNVNGGNADLYIEQEGNPYASTGGSAPLGGAGGSRGRCGRDGSCPGSEPNSPWAQDGGFPGGGGGGSDVGQGGFGANGQVTIEIVGLSPVSVDQKPYGYLDNAGCAVINGWAYDPDESGNQIFVHLYADGEVGEGQFLGEVVADISRPDVNSNMNIVGNHGFSFSLPDSLKDGQNHQIFAYAINSDRSTNLNNTALLNSPLSISGCTRAGLVIVPPPIKNNAIAFLALPLSVSSGESFEVKVKNLGDKAWGSSHSLVISKSDLSENLSMVSLSGTSVNGEKTVTLTAPVEPGNYILRAVEQNIEWFGREQFRVTAPVKPITPITPITPTTPTTPTVPTGPIISISLTTPTTPIIPSSGGNNGGNNQTITRDFIISSPSHDFTNESGSTATFTVVLTSAPTTDVFLTVNSSNWNEGTTSPINKLTFTSINWNIPQIVTTRGVDDTVDDGEISYTISVGPTQSADTNWNNLSVKTVSFVNRDDDSTPASGGGGSVTAQVSQVPTSTGSGSGSRRRCTGFGCPPETTKPAATGVIVPGDTIIVLDGAPAAASVIIGPEKVCPADNFITTFLRQGIDNNPNEVRKLQYFLNTYENASLIVNGEFDVATEKAVKALQSKHPEEILAPWGITESTGIVYITTTKYINTIYCRDNPAYRGNEDIKDIIDRSVLEPQPINPADFEGLIGQATSSISDISRNIASVSGSLSERWRNSLKDIHPYAILILLILLTGTWFLEYGTFKKDITLAERDINMMRGLAVLTIGSVLNVLNTLSFILNPEWFSDKTNLTLTWLLGLDLINLLLVIVVCLSILVSLYGRMIKTAK